jgi:hypothetical protein
LIVGSIILALIAVYPIAKKGNRKPFVATDNPVAKYALPWTNELPWSRAVDLLDFEGHTAPERLEKAQKYLSERGGGVIYFPPGVYRFQDDLALKNGIVLRGVTPPGDAKQETYFPRARLEFPRYAPEFDGSGSPKETAFKVIRLEDPATANNVGLVNLGINRARIVFGEGEGGQTGNNRLVVGCTLTNAADVSDRVPDTSVGQLPWQRYSDDRAAAIEVHSQSHALIANNGLPEGHPDDFKMDGYLLQDAAGRTHPVDGVVFDFNDRPGIRLTVHSGAGGVIRDNFIYSTGPPAIISSKGVETTDNTVHMNTPASRVTQDGIHQK